MKFLSNVLATLVGIFAFFILLFFSFLVIGAVFGSSDEGVVSVKENSVLEIDLSDFSTDYVGKYSDPLVTLFAGKNRVGVSEALEAIAAAADDDKIAGISLLNTKSALGMAQTKALRDALVEFRKSGKFVYAYSTNYDQKDYYLSSAAQGVYLNPVGSVDLRGLSTEVLFFKDFQEKSGFNFEVIRHGKYKSAVEPFLDNKMSEANREQLTEMLQSIWGTMATEITQSRKITNTDLNRIADSLGGTFATDALRNKLVDQLIYEDQYTDMLKKKLDVQKDEEINKVSLADYAFSVTNTPKSVNSDDVIAVIYAQGDILPGEGDVNQIGDGAVRRALREAREDENVKAVVLRVDSPGGDATTSELIWREIALTKKVKPVVVSMGNYAASGGYYIACGANKIIAEPNTITGSIGVFGLLPNMSNLADKAGIDAEQVSTHAQSASYSVFTPMNAQMRSYYQKQIEFVYDTFITRVADGRKMSKTAVDAIGQGRVWSGVQAKENGLVDALGGMPLALKEAAKLAKISEYKVRNYPEFDKTIEDMFGAFGVAKAKEDLLRSELGEQEYQVYQNYRKLTKQKGIQLRLPYEVKFN